MKKWSTKYSMLLMTAMLMLTGCAHGKKDTAPGINPGQSDLEYVQEKGTLIVGVTDYAPMDYRSGEAWTGFDAELANAFAESIDVTLQLKEIDWDKKTELLEEGSIDCIWNGMTMSQELQESISCSEPYLSNAQVVVHRAVQVKKADAAVVDLIMAAYYTGDGQEFEDLKFNIFLNDEKICVGLRRDSDLTEKVNAFLKDANENGMMRSLAEKYGIENAVL